MNSRTGRAWCRAGALWDAVCLAVASRLPAPRVARKATCHQSLPAAERGRCHSAPSAPCRGPHPDPPARPARDNVRLRAQVQAREPCGHLGRRRGLAQLHGLRRQVLHARPPPPLPRESACQLLSRPRGPEPGGRGASAAAGRGSAGEPAAPGSSSCGSHGGPSGCPAGAAGGRNPECGRAWRLARSLCGPGSALALAAATGRGRRCNVGRGGVRPSNPPTSGQPLKRWLAPRYPGCVLHRAACSVRGCRGLCPVAKFCGRRCCQSRRCTRAVFARFCALRSSVASPAAGRAPRTP